MKKKPAKPSPNLLKNIENVHETYEKQRDEKLRQKKRLPGRPINAGKQLAPPFHISLDSEMAERLNSLSVKLNTPRVVLVRQGIDLILTKKSAKG